MKAVILAGGFGTRLSEETVFRPKPMVEIGGKPILWHIMNIYAAQGVTEFIITLGYKAEIIKEYFLNFYAINNDLTVDLATGEAIVHGTNQLPWTVHLVDTGLHTQTGGRLKRVEKWLEDDEMFMFTYGDGVADLDIAALLAFHQATASWRPSRPSARQRVLAASRLMAHRIATFYEKPQAGEGWINGGYFLLNRGVLDYIDGDDTVWERDPIEQIAQDGEFMGYQHYGFWSCMDTLKEKNMLEELWNSGKAPWKIW